MATIWESERTNNVTLSGTTTVTNLTASDASLAAISKSLHIGAIVKNIIYDTSKDSDGGAWRKRCSDKSWYTETLGGDRWIGQQATIAAAWTAAGSTTGATFQASATAGPLTSGKYYAATSATTATEIFRGISREFPEQVAIVAETVRVVIYDLTATGTPMWMVFYGGGPTQFLDTCSSGHNVSSLAAANGQLVIGKLLTDQYYDGLRVADFIGDRKYHYNSTTYTTPYAGISYTGINTRNTSGRDYSTVLPYIVSSHVNDVAVTVLDNAPIDPATGLPVPTIAVATAGGVSVIKDDGTVVNSSSTSSFSGCSFSTLSLLLHYGASSGYLSLVDKSALAASFALRSYTNASSPAIWPISVSSTCVISGSSGATVLSKTAGIALLKENPAIPDKGMISYITNAYNSGWQVGDSRGAWLASTTAETLAASGELVTNGTFDTDTTGWTSYYNSTLSVDTSRLLITNGSAGTSSGAAYQGFTTVVGKTYRLSITITEGTSNTSLIKVGSTIGGFEYATSSNAGNVTYSVTFTPTTTTTFITVYTGSYPIGETCYFDNISVKLADPDRSVKNNGMIVNGSLTKAAVATGANLMAYSGFSAANYLEQPYSANHDYSTTGFSGSFWLKQAPNSAVEYLVNRDSATPAQAIRLWVSVAGYLVFELYDGTTTRTATGTVAVDDSTWKCVAYTYSAGTLNVYVNGVIYATATGAALLTLNNADAVLRTGLDVAGSYPSTNASMSLVRLSATVPSTDQIAQIYRDELPLFKTNAQCTIDGTSTAVTTLAYDDVADVLQVGTSWGRSAFRGLSRVGSEATTTGALTSLSANQGAIITGGTSAKFYQPAMLLRDELRRKEEARKALGKVPVFFEFDAVTSQVAFVMPKGYTTKAVYNAGTLVRVGSTKAYTVSTDGYQETVTFASAPGSGVWVSVMGVRA